MIGSTDLLSVYDYVAFHCNAPYHSKRNLQTMCDWMYGAKLDKADHQALYEKHVEPGTAISAQNVSVGFVAVSSSPDIDAHKSDPHSRIRHTHARFMLVYSRSWFQLGRAFKTHVCFASVTVLGALQACTASVCREFLCILQTYLIG